MAHLELGKHEIIFVRLKPDVKVTNKGYLENVAARKQLSAGRALGVVCIFPEDMDFNGEILEMDHYADEPLSNFTVAMAMVTGDLLYERLFKLHAKQYFHGVPHRVFQREADAVKWVLEQVAERG